MKADKNKSGCIRKKIDRNFFRGEDTAAIARGLLGKLLVVPGADGRRVAGMIVECEAYLGIGDRAAHSFGGRCTKRNEVTYGPGGYAYVFFVYGMYNQLNFVTGPPDHPHVVLIRAVEPTEGIDVMQERRRVELDKNLTSGPGKLCIAFAIDRSFNGEDLAGERIWLEEYVAFHHDEIAVGKRIGIDYAGEDAERPLRFWVSGNRFVSVANSGKRRDQSSGRSA